MRNVSKEYELVKLDMTPAERSSIVFLMAAGDEQEALDIIDAVARQVGMGVPRREYKPYLSKGIF
jgi:hypothetical protein